MVKNKSTRFFIFIFCLTFVHGLVGCSAENVVQPETSTPQSIKLSDTPFSPIANDWPHDVSDIAPDPRAKFGRLANGLRYVILPVPDEKDTVSIQLNVAAGFNDEPEGLYGIAHLLEHMAFRGSRSDKGGSIIHDLQSAGVKFGQDLNGFTRAEDTFYYVNLPTEDSAEIKTALRNISQFVRAPNLSAETLEAEKRVVLAELKARSTISRRAHQDFRQFQFPDRLRETTDGAGTEESLAAIELSDVKAFLDTHYIPDNVLLVVAGDVKTSNIEKSIGRLFSDWTSNRPPVQKDNSKAAITFADFPISSSFREKGAKTQINAIENLTSTLSNDVFEQRQKLFSEDIALSILKRRLNKHIEDDDDVSWITPFKSRYAEYDVRGFRSSAKDYSQMMTYFETERLRSIKYGFTEDEVDFAIKSKRAALERRAERPEFVNAWSEAWRISSDFAAGRVYNSHQENLENFETFQNATSIENFHDAAREIWSDFNPRYWTQSNQSMTETLEAVMTVPEAVSKLDLEKPSELSQSEFRLKDFPETGVVISRDKVASNKITRLLFGNGVRLNYQRREQEPDDIQIIVTIESDLSEIIDRYSFISERIQSFSRADIKGVSKEDIDQTLVGKKIRFKASFGRGKIELTSLTRPDDLDAALRLLATFISDIDLKSKYQTKALQSYKQQSDSASKSSPLRAGSTQVHRVYSDNAPSFKSRKSGFYPIKSHIERDVKNILESGAIEVGVVGDFNPELLEQAFAKSLGALPARDSIEQAPVFQTDDVTHIEPGLSTIIYGGTDEQMGLLYCWPRGGSRSPENYVYWELTDELMKNRIYESLREKFGLIYSPSRFKQSNPVFSKFQHSCFGVQIDPDSELQAHDNLLALITDLKTTPIRKVELDRALEPMKARYRKYNDSNEWLVWGVAEAYSDPENINEFQKQERHLQRMSLKKINKRMASFFERDDLHIFRVQHFDGRANLGLDELKVKSHLGDVEAQYELGRKLINNPLEADRKIALEALDELARDGHEDAISKMAHFYRFRKQDLKKTANYLEFSTQSPKSAYELAEIYVWNYETFPDVSDEKIMALYTRSAEGGWGRGQYGLAERLKDGTFTQRDEIGAMKWALISNHTRRGSLTITDKKEIERFVTGLTPAQKDEARDLAEKWVMENGK